jgi:hypothetical protein
MLRLKFEGWNGAMHGEEKDRSAGSRHNFELCRHNRLELGSTWKDVQVYSAS